MIQPESFSFNPLYPKSENNRKIEIRKNTDTKKIERKL